jgi:hypothetical protein
MTPTKHAQRIGYIVQCTAINDRPYWHVLETYSDLQKAIHRARTFALDQGGYVCVKDETGKTVYGTDPDALDRAITNGTNRWFPQETARRMGYVS